MNMASDNPRSELSLDVNCNGSLTSSAPRRSMRMRKNSTAINCITFMCALGLRAAATINRWMLLAINAKPITNLRGLENIGNVP